LRPDPIRNSVVAPGVPGPAREQPVELDERFGSDTDAVIQARARIGVAARANARGAIAVQGD
jgi:hypothetical protein